MLRTYLHKSAVLVLALVLEADVDRAVVGVVDRVEGAAARLVAQTPARHHPRDLIGRRAQNEQMELGRAAVGRSHLTGNLALDRLAVVGRVLAGRAREGTLELVELDEELADLRMKSVAK